MQYRRNGVLVAYMEGRFKCLACGLHGKLKNGFTIWSRCPRCSDYMIIPQQDLAIVTELPDSDDDQSGGKRD